MTPSPHSEKSIFLQAVEISTPTERAAFLDRVCGPDEQLRASVGALLLAHDRSGLLNAVAATEIPFAEPPGTMIGPYKLLQPLGEGGMGVVYMAEQIQPVQRQVALKLIKPGMDSQHIVARFEAERQALALMDHINIARVLDAGTTDSGHPYFVMELVHGVPITKYCHDHNLTLRQRLELFVPVCHAIQHAHQKGIIHRDIKPTNVMITLYDGMPVPKVIDFGVAKATEQKLTDRTLFTRYGTMVGTLEYMSPEQAEMSALGVDTRSDIYSLGVLLYELLTGSTPLSRDRIRDAAYAEILRMIKEEEPPKPSTRLSESAGSLPAQSVPGPMETAKLAKLVRGELDWIVMKCLEKDRNRRYETANNFAADVQRYLNDEAVQACPPSPAYRFQKFARRNRAAMFTAAIISAALMMGTIVSAWQARIAKQARIAAEVAREQESQQRIIADRQRIEAEQQRKQAEMARQEATANLEKAREAVDKLLTRVGDRVLTDVPQMESIRQSLLEDALEFYQGFLQRKNADPIMRLETARAFTRVGKIYGNFAMHEKEVVCHQKSIALLEKLVTEFPSVPEYRKELADSLADVGNRFCWYLYRADEGEPLLRRTLVIREQLRAEYPDEPRYLKSMAHARSSHANALSEIGRKEEAEAEYRRAYNEALELMDRYPKIKGKDELLAQVTQNLGALLRMKNLSEAEQLIRQALALRMKFLDDTPKSQKAREHAAFVHEQLAHILRRSGRRSDAEDAYRRAIEILRPLATDFPKHVNYRSALGYYYLELGRIFEETDRLPEAEQAYRQAWAVGTEIITPEVNPPPFWFGRLGVIQKYLVKFLQSAGRTPEIEAHYRQALSMWRRLAEHSPDEERYGDQLATTYRILGEFLLADKRAPDAQGVFSEAIAFRRKSLTHRESQLGPDHDRTISARLKLVSAYEFAGEFDQAIATCQEAISAGSKSAQIYNRLARILATCNEEKFRNTQQALQAARTATGIDPNNRDFLNTLAIAHYRTGDWKSCIDTIDKIAKQEKSLISGDLFFLAMAQWQLDDKEHARESYQRAVRGVDANPAEYDELARFRAEAEALLNPTLGTG